MGRPRIHTDISGKYGRLLIVEEVKGTPYSRNFLCKCECGNAITVSLNRLLSGNTKSCGCLKKDTNKEKWTIHGLAGSRLYRVWSSMKERCFNQKDTSYKNYGARGISVCEA